MGEAEEIPPSGHAPEVPGADSHAPAVPGVCHAPAVPGVSEEADARSDCSASDAGSMCSSIWGDGNILREGEQVSDCQECFEHIVVRGDGTQRKVMVLGKADTTPLPVNEPSATGAFAEEWGARRLPHVGNVSLYFCNFGAPQVTMQCGNTRTTRLRKRRARSYAWRSVIR